MPSVTPRKPAGQCQCVSFPGTKGSKLRLELAACRSVSALLAFAHRLVLEVENTSEGIRCEHCLIDHRPSPSCVLSGED